MMSTTIERDRPAVRFAGLRQAGETVKAARRKVPEPLFETFWREGELALLFGKPGSGKSVLAVQIADSLARGKRLRDTSNAAKRAQKVLYIDLVLSENQFAERYSGYEFAPRLFRGTPGEREDLFEFVSAAVAEQGFDSVIIDDLSLITRFADGCREALVLMHKLRGLAVEKGVSVLVLADSVGGAHDNGSPEMALRRSRVLCGVADSVFGLHDDELFQTRCRNGEPLWTWVNSLNYSIEQLDSGLLGMVLWEDELDDEDQYRIFEIKQMHDEDNKTFREIAEEMEISKSEAHRLYKQWTPAIHEAILADKKAQDDKRAYNAELDAWKDAGGLVKWDDTEKRFVKGEMKKPKEPPRDAALAAESPPANGKRDSPDARPRYRSFGF